MRNYDNAGGDSAIVAFENGDDSITVEYVDGSVYQYSYRKNGGVTVEQMKKYAGIGHGLYGFIRRFVGKDSGIRLH